MMDMFIEIDGKSYKVTSKSLREVLRRGIELPNVVAPVDRPLYLVVTGEDNGESGTGAFVHLVTRNYKAARRCLREKVKGLGFGWLKKGTNSGDESADQRYDHDECRAYVNTYGHGVSFEATVKEIRESEIDKKICK